ncbi:MAG: hypothetical protein ACOYLB_15015 [Phototrophicaceae bacterium]
MLRFLTSLLIGILVGFVLGLYLGWVPFPVEYVNSPASALAQSYKDDYTVMIANAWLQDGDTELALTRLRLLEVENIPQHVQDVTERYISGSVFIDEIPALVALSEALGRLTPIMIPYRQAEITP